MSPFVSSSGHGAEAVEGVDRSLELVPAGIPGPVDAGGPTTLAPAFLPMGPLGAALGDEPLVQLQAGSGEDSIHLGRPQRGVGSGIIGDLGIRV